MATMTTNKTRREARATALDRANRSPIDGSTMRSFEEMPGCAFGSKHEAANRKTRR